MVSWSPQVSAMCQKVYLILHHINKFKATTPVETRIRLVKSLILPHFDYCDFTFCDLDSDCMYRLQRAQNWAIRYIYNVNRRDHVTPLYKKLGVLKIKERRELNCLALVY